MTKKLYEWKLASKKYKLRVRKLEVVEKKKHRNEQGSNQVWASGRIVHYNETSREGEVFFF